MTRMMLMRSRAGGRVVLANLGIVLLLSGLAALSGCTVLSESTASGAGPGTKACSSGSFTESFVVEVPQEPGDARMCMPRSLDQDADGMSPCVVLAATASNGGSCDCAGRGLSPLTVQQEPLLADVLDVSVQPPLDCVCVVEQLPNDEMFVCQNAEEASASTKEGGQHGWCFVDATLAPPLGNPELTYGCIKGEERVIRLMGDPVNGQTLTHLSASCFPTALCAP